MIFILAASANCALLYGVFYCHTAPSISRVVLKVGATALLTLWAYWSGAPLLIVLALGLSTLGDGFLGASEERFLLPGMAAFFIAHAAYIPLFWGHPSEDPGMLVLATQIVITFGAAGFLRSLVPWVEPPMRIPVMAYTVIILVMVNAALRLEPSLWLAALGAISFAASDTILSLELFRLKQDARIKRLTSPAIWFLYFGGQAAIAWAFIQLAA